MKTISFFIKLLLPLALMVILFQGCYTQLQTTREEESYYRQEQEPPGQNDSTYYEDNDNWQSHQYLGFSYYYPCWNSNWAWDYGCVYPPYWDPWWWGATYFPYGYYSNYWGYYYPSHAYYYGHNYFYGHNFYGRARPYITRNSGYQRGGGSRGMYGAVRSGYYGNGGTGSVRRDVALPRAAGTTAQTGSYGATRTSRSVSRGVSTSRQSSGGRYNLNVQQPRHRDQSTMTIGRSYRAGISGNRVYSRSQGTSNGQYRSSERSSAPRYSPQPSGRTSAPQSAPAPRNDGGGQRSSGGRNR